MLILVLESSTSSAKAMLYDSEHGVIEVKTQAYLPEYSDNTTQDASGVFLQTVSLGKLLAEGKPIDMISLCGTFHSVCACDEQMNPITRVYSWPYTGAAEDVKPFRMNDAFTKDYYFRTGCMVHAIYPAFKIIHLKKQGLSAEKCRFVGQGSFNFFHLTGEWLVSESMASGSGLMNIHSREWDTSVLETVGIRPDQLGKLVPYSETRQLTQKGADLLGLSAGIPVVPAHPDGALNQVGAGALREGIMTFSVGTSAAIRLTTSQPIIPDHPSTWCYYSSSAWMSGAATNGACNCTDWVKRKYFDSNVSYAQIDTAPVDIDALPVFLPFLYGERCPGWHDERAAGFFDVRASHGPYDFYFSVMQGVLFNVYQCYKLLSSINGEPKRIKLTGGILNSPVWTQMCCDVFGRDMECSQMEQTSVLGGAVLALACGGVISSPEEFDPPADKVIFADAEMHERYMKKYGRYLYWYEKTV